MKLELTTPVAIIAAGVIIGLSVLYGTGSFGGNAARVAPADTGAGQPAGPAVNIKDVNIANNPFIGDPNAPVTLAYWFDHQCPFCQRFETQTLPALVAKYVMPGKLKIVFKNFAFLGPDSQTLALAERAVWAAAPQKFFDWQQKMFESQGGENSGWGAKDKILALTKQVPGIDANKVGELMDKNKDQYQKLIDADREEGQKFGINGTPGFVLGTQLIAGAQPVDVFAKAIDAALTKK